MASDNTGTEVFLDGPDEFRKAVRTEVKRGAEIIKTYGSGGPNRLQEPDVSQLTIAELRSVVETAHGLGVKVRSHCCWEPEMIECIEAGIDLVDHGTEITEKVAELMADRGTFWAPTLYLLKVLMDGRGEIPPTMQHQWDELVRVLPLANRMGVKIVPGDDYGLTYIPHVPGIYGRELALYAELDGIDPLDVIRWATRNGAELMGKAGELGTIAPGAYADMVVVDGDPLADMMLLADPAKLPVIMKDGVLHKRELV
jgi:imidazolonepropionase-like amidohydrolase